MARIKILPEILSNKIAAGEVVERPASVVKELVENAIDAKSSRIHVEIEKGGRALIRVSDNGCGMSPDDALLAIERYATSKIMTDADLFCISSLGFRGEALPSIASVSKFSLVTRNESQSSGTEINIEGGKITQVTETGAPPGTMITVKQLFYNTPARRKFLKTINTEMAHIADVVSSVALGWPEVQFRLRHNGKEIKHWPQAADPFTRAADVLGKDLKKDLHQIYFNEGDLSVSGLISSPGVVRSTSQKIYLFVNGRYIRDRGLQHALFEGYRGRIMKGVFPVAVIYINLPPDMVDVNVHPTKHEVRFADKKKIYTTLKNTVSEALSEVDRPRWSSPKPAADTSSFIYERQVSFPPPEKKPPVFHEKKNEPDDAELFKVAPADPSGRKAVFRPKETEKRPPAPTFKRPQNIIETPVEKEPENDISIPLPETPPPMPVISKKAVQTSLWKENFFSTLTIIGQLRNTYILCESKEGLIIVDQHAAHERVKYEALKKKSDVRKVESQTLLIPETIDLNYREADVLEKMIPHLSDHGLEIEPFGGNTFVIKSVPSILSEKALKPLVLEMIEKMIEIGFNEGVKDAIDECLIIMACHSVIRAHQQLRPQEIKTLLEQLDNCESPSHCPHGRPTWINYTDKDIEKAFKRVL